MRRYKLVVACLFMLLIMTGCGKSIYPELPKDAVAFECGEYQNKKDAEDSYASIRYQGREYVFFGTLSGRMKETDIEACIGYIVDEGDSKDTGRRVYTLTADKKCDYLMDHIVDGMMEQPSFWRAVDTIGEEVDTPSFIDDLGYDIWK